jgi:hypothetical protein
MLMLASPVTLTLMSTGNTWETYNVSADVGSSATGAILLFSYTGATGNRGWARMTGSSDTYEAPSNFVAGEQHQVITGLNGGQLDIWFDVNPNSAGAACTVQLIGYWGSEAYFNQDALAVSSTTTAYATYSLSSLVPEGTTGAIMFFVSAPDAFGARTGPAGGTSTDDFSTSNTGGSPAGLGQFTVGLDSNYNFQLKAQTHPNLVLMGYFTNILWNLNAVQRTPATTGSPQALTTQPGAIAYLYNIEETAAYDATVCASGISTLSNSTFPNFSAGQILSGAPPTANISNAGCGVYELGYFTATAPSVSGPIPRQLYVMPRAAHRPSPTRKRWWWQNGILVPA